MKLVSNKLRVCHFPQVPCEPFIIEVKNEEHANVIINALANQHFFLYSNGYINDYSNTIIVEMWDEDSDGEGNAGWVDYWNDEEGMDFDEFEQTYFN